MSVQEIIDELKSLGNYATKRTLEEHGAREPFFGVKVEDLKKILPQEIERAKSELLKYENSKEKDLFHKAYITSLETITKLIITPAKDIAEYTAFLAATTPIAPTTATTASTQNSTASDVEVCPAVSAASAAR